MARTQRRRRPSRARGRRAREEAARFHILAVNVTTGTYRYLREVFYLGWEGSPKKPEEMDVNPDLKELIINGAHHVLRGGTVRVIDDKAKDYIELRVSRVPADEVEGLRVSLERSIEETREFLTLIDVEGVEALT
jgi:hypothetical protein